MNRPNNDSEHCPLSENQKFGSRRCSVCDQEFLSEKSYFGHLRVHSSPGEGDGGGYRNPEDFLEPESRLRGDTVSLDRLSKPFKCAICENVFDRASQLDYHRRSVHLGEKSQICQICGKGFFRKNDLQTHLNVHLGTNQLICEICGRKFNHVSNLIRHCRTHAGSKPYPCTICGKRFTQISSLSRHKNIHTRKLSQEKKKGKMEIVLSGEESTTQGKTIKRQHYCRVCGETFQFMILLRQHKKIHTKILEKLKTESMNDGESEKLIFLETVGNHSMGNLMELDKMNSIDVERDVSISDILSPYNCNDIELSREENLEEKLYGNFSLDSTSQKIQEQIDEFGDKLDGIESDRNYRDEVIITSKLTIPMDKVYMEVEGISSVDDLEEICFEPNEAKGEEINLEVAGKSILIEDDLDLRRNETEMGEKEFYELMINSKCDDFVALNVEKTKEQFFSQIVEDNCELMEKANDEFGDECSSEFPKYLPNANNCPENCMDEENTPKVRLVQNEDGEQFFELVREPLEYEKSRGIDKNPENSSVFTSVEENSKICKIPNTINSNPGSRKDRKEISLENLPKVVKDRSRKFKCNECDKWFSTAYNFKQHAGTHFFDQQKYRCEHCGLSFAWKSTLNKHLAGNHRPDGPQKFVCEICPKVYSTLSQVNEHVKRDHLKERNHVCELCGKSFFKKFDLKTHSRTHTKERPYICRACGKGFHHQSHIIRHERIHSGERPYECPICQKTFAQPSSLKSHRQRHREVRIDILEYRMDEDDPLTLAVQ